MNKQIKRIFSIILVFVMLCSIFSITASAATYTVTYYPGDGVEGETYVDSFTSSIRLREETYYREHYTQTGWSVTDGGAKKYNLKATYRIRRNIELYPYWTGESYTITYSPDQYTNETDAKTVNSTYGKSIATQGAIFTRDGYFQVGWATTENATEIEYDFGEIVVVEGNMNFYPVWTKIVYDGSCDSEVINFGSVCVGYTTTQKAQLVITNTGNVDVSVAIPVSEFYSVSITDTTVGAGEATIVTISPQKGLGVGVYKEKICFDFGTAEVDVSVDVAFNVRNHTYTDWAESIPATSDDAGVQSRYCGYCGLTEALEIPQLLCEAPAEVYASVEEGNITLSWNTSFGADSYNIYKLNDSGEWVYLASTLSGNELTYTDTGIYENNSIYTYAVTAVNEVGETSIVDSAVDVHYIIHEFGEWIERTPATCTTDGEMYRVCTICSAEESKVIASRGGHSFPDEWETSVKLTCTTDGEYYRKCNNCDVTETDVITAQGHSYSQEWTIDKDVTCTENGAKSHHCLNCGDKKDETIIEAIGHDYSLVATIDEHPHSKIYCCMNCGDEKQEPVVDTDCNSCIYDTVILGDGNIEILGYNGADIEIDIPSEIGGKTVVSISGSCFQGNEDIMYVALPESVSVIEDNTFNGCTSLQLVDISKNVTSIGDGAFSGCTALAEIMIYPGVVSIGEGAFDGLGGVIRCVRNSYAHNYAVENNLNYQILDIFSKGNTRIDYNEKVIFTSVSECGNIEDIIEYFGDVEAIATSRNPLQKELYGTGSAISLFAGDEYLGDYVVIVEGDVNGDSVCDALDMFETARLSNGKGEPTQEQIYAANGDICDFIDAASYQNVVNIAMS